MSIIEEHGGIADDDAHADLATNQPSGGLVSEDTAAAARSTISHERSRRH